MHQTRKGNQWYFGMKVHVGVDSRTQLIHSVEATAANVADCRILPQLHGNETRVWGDQADRGQGNVIREKAPAGQKDFTNRRYRFRGAVDESERAKNRTKSKVRAKVEHVFAVIKLRFGFTKMRYRGLAKNLHRLQVTCALANLYQVRGQLMKLQQA